MSVLIRKNPKRQKRNHYLIRVNSITLPNTEGQRVIKKEKSNPPKIPAKTMTENKYKGNLRQDHTHTHSPVTLHYVDLSKNIPKREINTHPFTKKGKYTLIYSPKREINPLLFAKKGK